MACNCGKKKIYNNVNSNQYSNGTTNGTSLANGTLVSTNQPNQLIQNAQSNFANGGQVNYYQSNGTVAGQDYTVQNSNYYDNYYTKQNNYYVNDVNYVTDHYQDYNVYHFNTQTVYNGTVYEGATNVVATNGTQPVNSANTANGTGSCGCKKSKCNKGSQYTAATQPVNTTQYTTNVANTTSCPCNNTTGNSNCGNSSGCNCGCNSCSKCCNCKPFNTVSPCCGCSNNHNYGCHCGCNCCR